MFWGISYWLIFLKSARFAPLAHVRHLYFADPRNLEWMASQDWTCRIHHVGYECCSLISSMSVIIESYWWIHIVFVSLLPSSPCWLLPFFYGPLVRYVKLQVAHAPGMPGTFSPPPRVRDPDMHHGTCDMHVPWCMPGSLTSDFLWSRWRGKRSRHSRRKRNPQFYVSGKRPISSSSSLYYSSSSASSSSSSLFSSSSSS